ncbi:MAG: DUF3987 domain-containing protein [Acidobacteria bacterium]|nr:DUF3987 domain-containing protein [Acidobacteriota bacterium]
MADAAPIPAFEDLRTDRSVTVHSFEPIVFEADPFPDPVHAAARHGLAGRFLEIAEKETEADPHALLLHFLVFFGNAVCPQEKGVDGPVFIVNGTVHRPIQNALFIGKSSKARKGTAKDQVRRPFLELEDPWVSRFCSGLSTGEGLIQEVRDPVVSKKPLYEGKGRTKKVIGYEDVETDAGAPDPRAMVIEPEFGRVLQVMSRERNTLSAVLREAWDCARTLRVMTRVSPVTATNASVSVIGHVTAQELFSLLSTVDQANGFANRFLFCAVKRSRELPEGGFIDPGALRVFSVDLRERLDRARGVRLMQRTAEARAHWRRIYSALSQERDGLLGALTARAEAHVLRLSMIYALADGSEKITVDHQLAACALWDYCERSTRFVFGTAGLGDPTADEIHRALGSAPEGMTRSEIRDLFNRNLDAAAISRALAILQQAALARGFKVKTSHPRPIEIWFSARYVNDHYDFTTLLAKRGWKSASPVGVV